jgi:phosphoglycolate phosphatase-like HAD superfamily hydrolase
LILPPRAVLFDWEGTLVDFQWNLSGAVAQAHQVLAHMGLPSACLDNHYAVLRNTSSSSARAVGIDPVRVRKAVDRVYDLFDDDALSRWSLRPHAGSVLGFLANRRVAAGLVTNIGRRAIEQALCRFGLEHAFQVVVTRDSVSMLKPDKEGIVTALDRLKTQPEHALFVGDSTADVCASKQAKVPVAIVTGGENGSETIASEKPDFMWDSLDTLRVLYAASQ